MVFVHPEHWGHGIGQLLLTHYRRAGFVSSGETKHLASGELIQRMVCHASFPS